MAPESLESLMGGNSGAQQAQNSVLEYRDFLKQQMEEKAELKRREEERQKLEDQLEVS